MEINDSIIKHYLRSVYFLNGTAYAGKSTMAAMLAEEDGDRDGIATGVATGRSR